MTKIRNQTFRVNAGKYTENINRNEIFQIKNSNTVATNTEHMTVPL
jgi:hypothetical protein